MRPAPLYRTAAALIALFAIGHTLGFRQVDPSWGIDALIEQMKQRPFQVQGMQRTYWDFFVGLGLFVTILKLFAALVAWQLAGLPPLVLASLPLIRWGFTLTFAAGAAISGLYLFPIPLGFSLVITVCLGLAAYLGGRPSAAEATAHAD